jgi:uncharacterized protein YjbJ (UPF0337 family)
MDSSLDPETTPKRVRGKARQLKGKARQLKGKARQLKGKARNDNAGHQ